MGGAEALARSGRAAYGRWCDATVWPSLCVCVLCVCCAVCVCCVLCAVCCVCVLCSVCCVLCALCMCVHPTSAGAASASPTLSRATGKTAPSMLSAATDCARPTSLVASHPRGRQQQEQAQAQEQQQQQQQQHYVQRSPVVIRPWRRRRRWGRASSAGSCRARSRLPGLEQFRPPANRSKPL
jgi:hypothetical protein